MAEKRGSMEERFTIFQARIFSDKHGRACRHVMLGHGDKCLMKLW